MNGSGGTKRRRIFGGLTSRNKKRNMSWISHSDVTFKVVFADKNRRKNRKKIRRK